MKQLNKTAYNFSVSLILIPFFIILNFLNKKESKVICKREFEIILLQTQSLLIKPFKGDLQSDLRMCIKEPTFYDTNSLAMF